MSYRIILGDCREAMRTLEPASVGAIVCDPPYHLTQASRRGSPRQNDPATPFGRTRLGEKGFMGKTWDGGGVAFEPETWSAALACAVPGARLLAFGGTRTFHRLSCAIEDAGWEIEDCLSWLYGSGFPKHKSKLKPAWEPVVMARKPASRATPLNIDGCRLDYQGDADKASATPQGRVTSTARTGAQPNVEGLERAEFARPELGGRWPANVVLDEDSAAMLDEQAPDSGASIGAPAAAPGRYVRDNRVYGEDSREMSPFGFDPKGGASRFFYTAKASRTEREAGLDGLAIHTQKMPGKQTGFSPATGEVTHGYTGRRRNHHPTVKPLDLMQWLVRLVTPPGGLVLDPFCGSGTTGCAALMEGMSFIGIEQDPEYAEIARRRLAHWGEQVAMPIIAEGA